MLLWLLKLSNLHYASKRTKQYKSVLNNVLTVQNHLGIKDAQVDQFTPVFKMHSTTKEFVSCLNMFLKEETVNANKKNANISI